MSAEDAAREALEAEETKGKEPEEGKTYSADYVKALRDEAAEWRVKAQNYKQPWEGVTEDDQKVWQDVIRTTQRDPKAGAKQMKEIAKFLTGEQEEQAAAEGRPAPAAVTQKDVERMVEERVQQSTLQQTINQINVEATAMGYTVGTQDYMDLLWVAEHETDADLKKADQAIQDRRQKWVDDYLEKKSEGGSGWPMPTRGGSAAATQPKDIKTFADAKASMMARLNRDW